MKVAKPTFKFQFPDRPELTKEEVDALLGDPKVIEKTVDIMLDSGDLEFVNEQQ